MTTNSSPDQSQNEEATELLDQEVSSGALSDYDPGARAEAVAASHHQHPSPDEDVDEEAADILDHKVESGGLSDYDLGAQAIHDAVTDHEH